MIVMGKRPGGRWYNIYSQDQLRWWKKCGDVVKHDEATCVNWQAERPSCVAEKKQLWGFSQIGMSIGDDGGFAGGSCTYNTTTGIPDENCYFVPDPSANVSRWFKEPWIICNHFCWQELSCCFPIEIFTLHKTSVPTWRCPSLMLWPTSVMIQRNIFTTRVSCSTFVTKSKIQ